MSVYALVERNCVDHSVVSKGITISMNLNALIFMLRRAAYVQSGEYRRGFGNDAVSMSIFDDVEATVVAYKSLWKLKDTGAVLEPDKCNFPKIDKCIDNYFRIYVLTWKGFKPISRGEVEKRKKESENASFKYISFMSMCKSMSQTCKRIVWS